MSKTKTTKAKELFKQGDLKGTLRIVKCFKIGVSEQEKRTIQIAYESLSGKQNFYISLGIDVDAEKYNAKKIVSRILNV